MQIIDTKVHDIRPARNGAGMCATVTFAIKSTSDARAIAHFQSRCAVPLGTSPEERVAKMKAALVADALRQARRMPEYRARAHRPAHSANERAA